MFYIPYIYIYKYIYIYIYIYIYVCVYVCVWVYVCESVCERDCVCVCDGNLDLQAYIKNITHIENIYYKILLELE